MALSSFVFAISHLHNVPCKTGTSIGRRSSPSRVIIRERPMSASRPTRFPIPLCSPLRPHHLSSTAALPQLLVDATVVSTSLNASCNLVALCGFIIWMQKCGHLPSNTAPVLSQVSFNLVIPCFLMSKVSNTIALQPERRILSLPLIAIAQVIVGGILGKLACTFLYRRFSFSTSEHKNVAVNEALITAACAFGNCVTLPLVFLNGTLSPTDYGTAAGYLALFMVGWSPCLWTVGYQIMSSTSGPLEKPKNYSSFSLHDFIDWWKQLMNPPLYGVLMGILVGATPLSHFFLPAKHRMLVLDTDRTRGFLLSLCSSTASILQPILEAATLLGSATVPLQAIVLGSTLATSIGHGKDIQRNNIARSDGIAANSSEQNIANGTAISLEGKAFWVITVVRLLVMPLISLVLLTVIQHRGWLPADPISRLTVLVVAAMPTAQNLVVLAQLHSNTRPLAGVLANLLVRQYLVSVVSLTIWMPIFFSCLRIGPPQ